MARNTPITVICYGQIENFASKKQALAKYYEGMLCCDGHEAERYACVCDMIQSGVPIAWDFEEVPAGWEDKLKSIYGDF